jgi:hypothetical protein
MAGLVVLFIVTLVVLHVLARKTKFYRGEFLQMNITEQIIGYILFLIVSGFISAVASLLVLILISNLMRD